MVGSTMERLGMSVFDVWSVGGFYLGYAATASVVWLAMDVAEFLQRAGLDYDF